VVAFSKVCAAAAAAAESAMDVEKAGYAKEQQNGVVCAHEGVGDPFTYRGRTGAFTAYEWAVQIVLPILVVLLGALPLEASLACRPRLEEREFICCLDWCGTVTYVWFCCGAWCYIIWVFGQQAVHFLLGWVRVINLHSPREAEGALTSWQALLGEKAHFPA
jgi:transposase InsO family protein